MAVKPQPFVPSLAAALTQASTTPTARQIARSSLLDTVACITAGWTSPQQIAVRRSQDIAGPTGAAATALRLGTAAHALDYDDFEAPGSTHPSAVLVAVLLGLSAHHTVSIAQAEEAYVSGYRAILALGQGMRYDHYMAGWHATATLGSVGAAACSSWVLKLDAMQTGHALSLAMTQAAGAKAQFGYDAKAVHAGLAARNGIEAAYLAAGGITAAPDIYETAFAPLYGGAGHRFTNLPELEAYPPFRKLSPSCGYTLRAIDAACDISGRVAAQDIAAIEIEMAEPYAQVVPFRSPKTPAEARFSATWCVASALLDGHVGLAHFEAGALNNMRLHDVETKAKVIPYPLPDGAGDMAAIAPDRVRVIETGGQVHQVEVAVPRGAPTRALDPFELQAKLLDCGCDPIQISTFEKAAPDEAFAPGLILPSTLMAQL